MTTPFIPDLAILNVDAVVEAPAVAVKPVSAIPSLWDEQRVALRGLEAEQQNAIEAAAAGARGRGVVIDVSAVLGGQPLITSRHFEALEMQPVTAGELAQLASTARGQYRAGDTRSFVRRHEETCSQFNCWMTRNADGSAKYLSEPPKL